MLHPDVGSRPVPHSVESARQEWEEGDRRLRAYADDRSRQAALSAQADAVREELRRRVGQTFTLADLDRAYREADSWIHEVGGDPRDLAVVAAAAFHQYARGAVDYEP
jgi:hypothetical protein